MSKAASETEKRSTTQVINPNPNDVSENSTDVIDGTISHISIQDVNNNNASNVNTQNSTDQNFTVSLTCNKFKVDYSKLGTAKCRKCKKSILKGTLRIGKYVTYKTVIILHYFHLECGFDLMRRARVPSNTVKDVSELDGIDSITNDEISQITKLIQATPPVITTVTTPRPTTQLANGTDTTPNPTKCRIKTLKSQNLPSLKIMFTNADQLTTSKIKELRNLIQTEKPLLVAVSEVKLKNSDERTEVDYNIPDFSLHPLNLDTDKGRGILVYTHSSLEKSSIQIDPIASFDEACFLEIRLRNADRLLFGCCYRSPTKTTVSNTNNDKLNSFLRSLPSKKYTHRCLVGDFNYRKRNWSSWTSPGSDECAETKFIESIRDAFLYQHVKKLTRRRGNDDPSTLDLILTEEELQVSESMHLAPLGKSDHSVISFNFLAPLGKSDHSVISFNFLAPLGKSDHSVISFNFLAPLGKSDHSVISFNFHCYIDFAKQKIGIYTIGETILPCENTS